jgi:hypothetical protein
MLFIESLWVPTDATAEVMPRETMVPQGAEGHIWIIAGAWRNITLGYL